MLKKVLLFVAILTLSYSLTAHASLMSLLPGQDLSGPPDSTVGWGFTITSDTYFLMIMSSPVFTSASPVGWGDFTGNDRQLVNLVVAPGIPVTYYFDPVLLTGVGSFAIYSDAIPGSVATGTIDLTYGLFTVSPNDPLFTDADILSLDNPFSNPASVTVTDPAAVPEPSTYLLLGISLGVVGYARRRLSTR